MGIRVAVALACLLVCGCYPSPPYVNPLTAEQLDGVRISEIRIEHLQDGSIDAEKAAKAATLVRARLIERLGANSRLATATRFSPLRCQLRFGDRGRKTVVSLSIRGKIVGAKLSAEYVSGTQAASAIMGGRLLSPEELLGILVNVPTADLTRQILCCAVPTLKKPPG